MNVGVGEAEIGTAKGVVTMTANTGYGTAEKAGFGNGSPRSRVALDGIYQKFGQSLPLVERVPGTLTIADMSPTMINGWLATGEKSIRVRFEANARGPLPSLRRYLEALQARDVAALSVVSLSVWVSGRAWVEQGGVIVVLVRSFGVELPANGGGF